MKTAGKEDFRYSTVTSPIITHARGERTCMSDRQEMKIHRQTSRETNPDTDGQAVRQTDGQTLISIILLFDRKRGMVKEMAANCIIIIIILILHVLLK